MTRHFLAHLCNIEGRNAVLQEIMGTLLQRNGIFHNGLALYETFAPRIRAYEEKFILAKILRARPVLSLEFLELLLDPVYLDARIRVARHLLNSIELFDLAIDELLQPTLASSMLFPRVLPDVAAMHGLWQQRSNRMDVYGHERLHNQITLLQSSRHEMDIEFLAACGSHGNFMLLCGLGSEILRLLMLFQAYQDQCHLGHFDRRWKNILDKLKNETSIPVEAVSPLMYD
jgi:hypothetical protein